MAHPKRKDAHGEHERMERASGARYWIVWIALLVGTIVTYAVARVHLAQPWALLVAMAIACTKAMLVVLFFMHLWDHGGANRLVFGTSVFFVVLLIGLVVLDNATRFPLANPGADEATLRMQPPGPEELSPRAPHPAEGRGAQHKPAPAPRH
jgi:cytochrome c oxidase subunit IV